MGCITGRNFYISGQKPVGEQKIIICDDDRQVIYEETVYGSLEEATFYAEGFIKGQQQMIDKEIELDYGSTIDRTIPNGTKRIEHDGEEFVFNDGYWISTKAVMEISCTESTRS